MIITNENLKHKCKISFMNSYFWFEALSAQLKLKAPISGRVRGPAMSGTGYPTRVSGNPVSLRGGYWDYKFSRTRVRVPDMSGAGTRGLPVSPPLIWTQSQVR